MTMPCVRGKSTERLARFIRSRTPNFVSVIAYLAQPSYPERGIRLITAERSPRE
jgi:hypothetical protein